MLRNNETRPFLIVWIIVALCLLVINIVVYIQLSATLVSLFDFMIPAWVNVLFNFIFGVISLSVQISFMKCKYFSLMFFTFYSL